MFFTGISWHEDQREEKLETLKVYIEKPAAGGAGIARSNGKVVFVPGALPGEEVELTIVSGKKDYLFGEITEIHTPSPERIKPPCRYYLQCGGCDLQHASYAHQLQIKRKIMSDALERIGKLDFPAEELGIRTSKQWAYRRRARFHWTHNGWLGYRRKASREVIPILECPVLDPRLNALLASPPSRLDERYSVVAGDSSVAIGKEATELTLADSLGVSRTFQLDGRVFFQSNLSALSPILDMVALHPEGGSAVDLYSGVGTFAAFLEEHYEQVMAVERDRRCLTFAGRNLSRRTRFVTKPVERLDDENPFGKISRLVLDPPREGVDAAVLQRVLSWKPGSIVYISCNPATFARDVGKAAAGGYQIQAIEGIDLYPQTSHLECAALLVLP